MHKLVKKRGRTLDKSLNCKNSRRNALLEPYCFLAPIMISMSFLYLYPLLNTFLLAFQRYKLTDMKNIGFYGLANYRHLLNDPELPKIMMNTLKFVSITLIFQFLLGLILALALKKPFRGRGVYQSIVFLPWCMSSFAVGLMFRNAFNGEYGVINDLLLKIGLIQQKIVWIGSIKLALVTVIVATIWMGIPFFAIMYLAALQSIPTDVYEAAEIDGCGKIKQLFLITLPYIKHTLILTILIRSVWIFNSVEIILVMTEGGPAYYSEILTSYLYTKAYATLDFGFAAALGTIFIMGLLVYSLAYLKALGFDKAGDF
jgi:multiple sugar transport system permease protein